MNITNTNNSSSSSINNPCSITIFTGFLGSGKTTIILNLIEQYNNNNNNNTNNNNPISIPASTPIIWLKNEYGDLAIDSKLASESNITAIELLNGCICCTAVGQLNDTIQSILSLYKPNRILIETSGTASPIELVLELKRIQSHCNIIIDLIVNIIDCTNYLLYSNINNTTNNNRLIELQSKYTDIIILNKSELLSNPDRELDLLLDYLYSNIDNKSIIPKIKSNKGKIKWELIFDSNNNTINQSNTIINQYNNINNTITTATVDPFPLGILSITINNYRQYSIDELNLFLNELDREIYYRVKGMIRINRETNNSTNPCELLNWSFGRYNLTTLSINNYNGPNRLTIMGDSTISSPIKINKIKMLLKLTIEDSIIKIS